MRRTIENPARAAAAALAVAAAGYAAVVRVAAPTLGGLTGPKAALVAAAGFALVGLLPARWTKRALALVIAGGVALVVAEIALRVIVGDRYAATLALDARAIYKHIPGTSTTYSRSGKRASAFRIAVNSAGFRGGELRRDGGKRVVVYGDSYVEADYTDLPATFVAQLEQRLGPGVETVNAGVTGYGPDQVSMRLDDEIPALAPALVVVVVYTGNDFGDLVRDKLYRLDDKGELVQNRYVLSDDLRLQFEQAQRGSMLSKVWTASRAGVQRKTAGKPAQGVDDAVLRTCAEEVRDYEKGDVVTNLFADHYDADVAMTPSRDSARLKVRLMEKVVVRMAQIAERRRVPFLLVIAPTPLNACEGYRLGGVVDTVKYPEYKPSGLTDLMADLATRNGIKVVNLWEPFQKNRPCELFLHDHDHWNDAGQRLSAEVVADYIRSAGLL